MPRPIWSGSLSFGLVNVPVKLMSATRDRGIHFNQLHEKDKARIEVRRVCTKENVEVPWEEVARGYELDNGDVIMLTDEELDAADPKKTRTIDIEAFVDLEEIDPIYFDRPYHLVPGPGGAHPYRLLLHAMRDTGKIAIGRIVMRSKERLVAIRPREDALLMLTMSYADEVNPTTGLRELEGIDGEVDEQELDVARRLVASIAEPFDIDKYQDTFREAVLDLIDRKAAGEPLQLGAEPEPPPDSPDVMKALEASLERVGTS